MGITNIKGIAEFLTVSPDGSRYAVGVHRRADIYSIDTAGVEYSIDIKARPNCLVFLNNDTSEEIECVGSVDTTCRVTCMAVWPPGMRLGGKRKGEKMERASEVESPKKKVKLTEVTTEKKVVETVTVEEETNVAGAGDKKAKKKKKKPGKVVPTGSSVEAAG